MKDIPCAYRVVVKGLARDESGRLLFVRERSDTWDLPGGGLEHGEDIIAALRREFFEELCADIEILNDRPLVIPTWNTKFDDPVLILAYEVRLLTKPQTTADVAEFLYISQEQSNGAQIDSTLTSVVGKFYDTK